MCWLATLHNIYEVDLLHQIMLFAYAGVFFITKQNGNVDVWDLLDRYTIFYTLYMYLSLKDPYTMQLTHYSTIGFWQLVVR